MSSRVPLKLILVFAFCFAPLSTQIGTFTFVNRDRNFYLCQHRSELLPLSAQIGTFTFVSTDRNFYRCQHRSELIPLSAQIGTCVLSIIYLERLISIPSDGHFKILYYSRIKVISGEQMSKNYPPLCKR